MEGEDCQRCWSSDPSLHVHLPEAAGCVHRRKVWEVTLCMYRQLGPVENRMRVRSHTVHSELSGFSNLVVECHELPEEGTWWSLEGWARLGPCRGGWTAHGLSTRTKASRACSKVGAGEGQASGQRGARATWWVLCEPVDTSARWRLNAATSRSSRPHLSGLGPPLHYPVSPLLASIALT